MILVTGAAGFLGSQLIIDLVQHESGSIRAMKMKEQEIPKKLQEFKNIEWVDCDICNYSELETVLQGSKKVYHCAAIVSYNPKDEPLMFKINIEGTANVVDACLSHNVEKLMYVSSIAALGEVYHPEFITEEKKK